MLAAPSMHNTVSPVYIFLTKVFVKKSKNPVARPCKCNTVLPRNLLHETKKNGPALITHVS